MSLCRSLFLNLNAVGLELLAELGEIFAACRTAVAARARLTGLSGEGRRRRFEM
jgi:hypothetical protein